MLGSRVWVCWVVGCRCDGWQCVGVLGGRVRVCWVVGVGVLAVMVWVCWVVGCGYAG